MQLTLRSWHPNSAGPSPWYLTLTLTSALVKATSSRNQTCPSPWYFTVFSSAVKFRRSRRLSSLKRTSCRQPIKFFWLRRPVISHTCQLRGSGSNDQFRLRKVIHFIAIVILWVICITLTCDTECTFPSIRDREEPVNRILMTYESHQVRHKPGHPLSRRHFTPPLHTQGRSQEFDLWVQVLTSYSNFKTYVNVPRVNIYHIESVLGHRRRTTTYFFFKVDWFFFLGGGGIYRYTPPSLRSCSRHQRQSRISCRRCNAGARGPRGPNYASLKYFQRET